MGITNELREWFKDRIFMANGWQEIHDIADRIDAENESAMYDMRRENVELVIDRNANWVKLPVDADGEPIRIGDVMAYKDNTKPMEVVALVPPVVFLTEEGPRFADTCRHYHKRTVEDVLREFMSEFNRDDTEMCDEEIIERFAAKLRLVDDGKEQ